MKNFRPLDFLIIFFVLTLGIFLCIKSATKPVSKIHVTAAGIDYEYSAQANGTYKVQGSIGETTFEIKNGKARIIDSPCPNKICVHQGWDSPLVCLPNNVIIIRETGKGDFDVLSN